MRIDERAQIATAAAMLLFVGLACRRHDFDGAARDGASSSAHALPDAPPMYTVIGEITKTPSELAVSQEPEMFQGREYTVFNYEFPSGINIEKLELHVRHSDRAAWTLIVRSPYADKLKAEDFAPFGGAKLQTGNEVDTADNTISIVYDLTSGPLRTSVLWLRGDHVLVIKSHKEAYP